MAFPKYQALPPRSLVAAVRLVGQRRLDSLHNKQHPVLTSLLDGALDITFGDDGYVLHLTEYSAQQVPERLEVDQVVW